MQSRMRAMKRGHLDAAGYIPRHKTTKNRKGQQWHMQLITKGRSLRPNAKTKFASDANQKIHNTLFHLNPEAV